MKVEIVTATEAHAREVAKNLRVLDCQELRKILKLSPEAYVLRSLGRSTHAWAGLIDGRVVCLFGLMAESVLAARATAWLFTTPDVERHPRVFWRGSKAVVRTMLSLYPTVGGVCDARFAATVRWLSRLGFKISADARLFAGVPFLPFEASHG